VGLAGDTSAVQASAVQASAAEAWAQLAFGEVPPVVADTDFDSQEELG